MTVSTFATFRFVESLNYDEVALFVTGDNHLGDALAVVDDKLLLREVDEQHTHLAAIVGIDGTRTVQNGDTLFQSKSATWTDLRLETCGQCDVQACRYESALEGFEYDGFIQIGTQVHACALFCGISRKLLMATVDYVYFDHVYKFTSLQVYRFHVFGFLVSLPPCFTFFIIMVQR